MSRDEQVVAAATSASLAKEVAQAIASNPRDYSGHLQKLSELKSAIVQTAAQSVSQAPETTYGRDEFLWRLAQDLPPFDTSSLYQKRASLCAILAAVLIGWLAGGLVSTLFDFVGLGGEILRPLMIFLAFWLEEYLCVNPRARKILLTVLGFAGLARFASLAVNGFFRFTTLGALRSAIFGTAAKPGFFRLTWMFFGAFLILAFLSRKISALDLRAFEESLRSQIEDRFKLCEQVLQTLQARDEELFACQKKLNALEEKGTNASHARLIQTLISLLPTFSPQQQSLLLARLKEAGYSPDNHGSAMLVWDKEKYGAEYETIGLINDGDLCLVLRPALHTPDGLRRGRVQKAPQGRD